MPRPCEEEGTSDTPLFKNDCLSGGGGKKGFPEWVNADKSDDCVGTVGTGVAGSGSPASDSG